MKKRKVCLILLMISLICGFGCKTKKTSSIDGFPLQFVWSWEEDQNRVGEGNVWNGFVKEGNLFKATNPVSRFAFWRKTVTPTLFLEYKNAGKASVRLFLNGVKIERLAPAARITRKAIKTDRLYQGLNFVEFRKGEKIEFYIKDIYFEDEEETSTSPNFQIEKGEKLHIPFEAGKVSLVLKGKGSLRMRAREAMTSSVLKVKKIANVFSFFKKKSRLSSPSPFIIELQGLKGKFSIQDVKFVPHEVKKPPPETLFIKKPFPDIYILLIDGCQASHLGAYGYSRDTSPHIDALAKDSVVFENAYSNAAFTRAAVATIFTGLYPEHHKVRVLTKGLLHEFLTLPEFLKNRGYQTSLFSSSANISGPFGFRQGVDEFYKYFGQRKAMRKYIASDFIEWLKRTGNGSPRFSYLHFKEPHFPILPPPPFLNMYKKDPPRYPVILRLKNKKDFSPEEIQDLTDDYDSTIAYVDHLLGKILDHMKETDSYDQSLIVFLSDHGEALYEHKFIGHGGIVFDEVTRIPLLVKFPSAMNIKGRVRTVVQTTDIFPTISRLFRNKRKFDGRSLVEAYFQKEQGNEYSVSRNFIMPGAFGLRWRDYYYIMELNDFTEELYNVNISPEINIIDKHKALSLFLRTKFLAWLCRYQTIQKKAKQIDLTKLSPAELENLRALGYIE
ncbi:MAG: sulfatase-like hydrolase/transferase [Candidatus Aminicenantes bacterium]|nr:sulfatase-like hydrolase/transferase [Candidatus Aminicenantes bacterium]